MKRFYLLIDFLMPCMILFAQAPDDTTQTLQEITLKAYEQNYRLMQMPASVSLISKNQLTRFNNTTILPAMNNHPGVRMEERSPGSYRLNIRGSSLRSPFGVRNVKVYYNDIPYTDPGGNTYLNQLGYYNIQSLEIIKGPGSSLYGAGTGGVLLINTKQTDWHPGLSFSYSAGSWSQNNLNTNLRIGTADFKNTVNYSQLSSHGYRDHTELERKVFTWNLDANVSEKGKISTHLLWGDLYYETPGGLTYSEYTINPQMARPRTGPVPGAEENKAAIFQKMFLAGISFNQKFSEYWENTTSFYGAATELKNPSIRNYGRASEPHTGGRTMFRYAKQFNRQTKLTAIGGIEFQQGLSTVKIYSNINGHPDTLQTDDEINNRVYFAFAQATLELKSSWFFTAGASINAQRITITRLSVTPVTDQSRKYNNELAPRIAVLKKLGKNFSVQGSIARGFSPPTTAEILPSSGIISTSLNAEEGMNYETGVRLNTADKKIYAELTGYYFRLKNTIVQRRDAGGGDYFVNAGSTRQKGLEAYALWQILDNVKEIFSNLKVWSSYTFNDFSYENFKQISNDFSGNKLPGVAKQVLAAGIDLATKPGVYLNLNYYYSDPIPLNDANSSFASSFHLLNARTGWNKKLHPKVMMELFVAADNIFNAQYSLGNDINAFGGRYYNAAPAFNVAGGISLHFRFN